MNIGIIVYIIIIIAVIAKSSKKGSERMKDRKYHRPKPPVSAKPNEERRQMGTLNRENKESEQKNGDRQSYYIPPYSSGEPKYLGKRLEDNIVGENTHVVRCSYCGAENVVPCHNQGQYHCYFCWENLN